MRYFPLYLRLKDTRCLMVGGGEVALRKTRLLLKSGTAITLIAPEIHPELAELATAGDIKHTAAAFAAADLSPDYTLVVAATDDRLINQRVSEAAAKQKILCNVVDDRELSTAIMPAIVDRSPLLIAVSSGGESPVMTTRIRQQLEQLFPPAYGKLVEFAGAWRERVKQRFNSIGERRRFWQRTLEGPLTRQVLAGETQAATATMQQELNQPADAANTRDGFAWIIGAGPGDPELLTLKAARVLAQADVILHDRLVAPAILELARREAEFISVGKQAGKTTISQQDINALLVSKVHAGKRVCRLKGGDPFIFGRGGEEVEALQQAGLPWQVIPGITAASGCAAASGVPLTHREIARSVLFITASTADETEPDWEAIARAGDTLVFYMALSKLEHICASLRNAGKQDDCPALVIENGTTDRQRMIRGTLATLSANAQQAQITSPAILMVGAVTELAQLLGSAQLDNAEHQWAPAAKAAGSQA
jgi:uroporphyrin-III C-methyltransferase/precorrin-2 dehydrogenase/sirohydrochlorin ferrochelatase